MTFRSFVLAALSWGLLLALPGGALAKPKEPWVLRGQELATQKGGEKGLLRSRTVRFQALDLERLRGGVGRGDKFKLEVFGDRIFEFQVKSASRRGWTSLKGSLVGLPGSRFILVLHGKSLAGWIHEGRGGTAFGVRSLDGGKHKLFQADPEEKAVYDEGGADGH